jgi:hypothetical protein
MNTALRYEWVEERILGALRFVDVATGTPVSTMVSVTAPGLRLLRKRSGDLAVLSADGLDPVAGTSYPVDVRANAGGYGRRRYTLRLPRDPDPAHAALPGSVFQSALVSMLPGPRYPVNGNLAMVRVTVRRSTDNARIGGALVRLTPSVASVPPARALTDIAGEAMLVVPGVPLSNPGPGATVVASINASLDALVDPLLASFTVDAELDAVRATDAARIDGFLDPDDLEARLGGAPPPPTVVQISAGRMAAAPLSWAP